MLIDDDNDNNDNKNNDYENNYYEDDEKFRMITMINIIIISSVLLRVPNDDYDYVSLSKRDFVLDIIWVIKIWNLILMIIITMYYS